MSSQPSSERKLVVLTDRQVVWVEILASGRSPVAAEAAASARIKAMANPPPTRGGGANSRGQRRDTRRTPHMHHHKPVIVIDVDAEEDKNLRRWRQELVMRCARRS